MSLVPRTHDDLHEPRCFRLTPKAGVWHLVEANEGAMGGVFGSITAAVSFVRAQTGSSPGTLLIVELFDRA